jgi:glycosyltransferase involved in cell wall biosynthesis
VVKSYVSVVVPVYNEAKRLEALVASLRAQDYTGPLELVLVDGESTDESLDILQRVATESTNGPSVKFCGRVRRSRMAP